MRMCRGVAPVPTAPSDRIRRPRADRCWSTALVEQLGVTRPGLLQCPEFAALRAAGTQVHVA
jgi:hypothetical protein